MLNNYKQIKILNINEFAVYSKKRNCYSKIADFINASNSTNKKICIIYVCSVAEKQYYCSKQRKKLLLKVLNAYTLFAPTNTKILKLTEKIIANIYWNQMNYLLYLTTLTKKTMIISALMK